jgi:gamma-glutamyltranspeptidase / glutathione hydrolase
MEAAMLGTAAVAAGHPATVRAAWDVLTAGGNAFDAAVAAGFTAAVAEPMLSGLAGGGFLLAAPVGADPVLYDFFVDVPGLGGAGQDGASADPVTVRFAGADQVFHVGAGSVAVPGCLAGYLHVHARHGRLPLTDLVAPAARLAADGVVLGHAQAAVVRLLAPILAREPEGAARFAGIGGAPFGDAQRVSNPALAAFLSDVGSGRRTSFADADLAPRIVAALTAQGGTVTTADLAGYRVIEREPLCAAVAGATLLTNPPPSFGGSIVARALAQLAALPRQRRGRHGDGARLLALVTALEQATAQVRLAPPAVVLRARGTTHVSVRDAEGNVAAMTTSNGSNSGVHLAGTGVMANNIMGEEDLHPAGIASARPGVRIGSMMAPSLLLRPGRPAVVLGSGGSERIRSAITQVVAALVFDDLPLVAAVLAPRVHVDAAGTVQAEPGLAAPTLAALAALRPVNVWTRTDLYFGGVHAVASDGAHVGDPRRGGVSLGGVPGGAVDASGTVADLGAGRD